MPTVGQRFVFKGVNENPMLEMESNLKLPGLNEGEVLVKVRAATICQSDIHTVNGTRIEPTPRFTFFFKTNANVFFNGIEQKFELKF